MVRDPRCVHARWQAPNPPTTMAATVSLASGTNSGPTRSSPPSVKVAWARCIRPATHGCSGQSPSRYFSRRSRPTPIGCGVFHKRLAPPAASTIPTSWWCTTSASTIEPPTSSASCSRARHCGNDCRAGRCPLARPSTTPSRSHAAWPLPTSVASSIAISSPRTFS